MLNNKTAFALFVHIGRTFLFVLAFFMIVPFMLNLESTLFAAIGILIAIAFIIGGFLLIQNSFKVFTQGK